MIYFCKCFHENGDSFSTIWLSDCYKRCIFSLPIKCMLKSQLHFGDSLYEIKVNQHTNPRRFRKGPITRNNFNPMVLQKIAMELFIYFAKYPCQQACYIKDYEKNAPILLFATKLWHLFCHQTLASVN